MQIAILGLGRMGANMARRLARGGHQVVLWARRQEQVDTLLEHLTADRRATPGAAGGRDGPTPACAGTTDLDRLVALLAPPRHLWLMLPAGQATEEMIQALASRLAPGDTLIDGGNTRYSDDVRRARELAPAGLHYLDVGTSGGVWGLERGYCLMIGGPAEVVRRLDPIFKTLAPGMGDIAPAANSRAHEPGQADGPGPAGAGASDRPSLAPVTLPRSPADTTASQGYLHCGPAGAGHFVKMVHNGIEYGLMQAYAEGFELLAGAAPLPAPASGPGSAASTLADPIPADERYDFDLPAIAELWRRGSVVGSWLLDLTAAALAEDPRLAGFSGQVSDSGEGRWTVERAIAQGTPADVLASALFRRFRSRQGNTFGEKLLSAMRKQFGGHVEVGAAPGRSAGR